MNSQSFKKQFFSLKEVIISWEISGKSEKEQEILYRQTTDLFNSVWLRTLDKMRQMDGIKIKEPMCMYAAWFFNIVDEISPKISSCLRFQTSNHILVMEPEDWK